MASLLSLHSPSVLQPKPSPPRMMTLNSIATLGKSYKMRVPYELKQGQTRLFHQLPSGLQMEVIEQTTGVVEGRNENPPLVFVHGSYHAAWCWAEHWLPFFSDSGFPCYALSLLGQVILYSPSNWFAAQLGSPSSFANHWLILDPGWKWRTSWDCCWDSPGIWFFPIKQFLLHTNLVVLLFLPFFHYLHYIQTSLKHLSCLSE